MNNNTVASAIRAQTTQEAAKRLNFLPNNFASHKALFVLLVLILLITLTVTLVMNVSPINQPNTAQQSTPTPELTINVTPTPEPVPTPNHPSDKTEDASQSQIASAYFPRYKPMPTPTPTVSPIGSSSSSPTSSSNTSSSSSSNAPTPTPTTASCVGQAITPVTDIQAAVTSAPEGTTFCFAAGTYTNVSISPKTGQIFNGQNRTAILDGTDTTAYAFNSTTADNVTIKGFVIKQYDTPLQEGAIQSFDTDGWIIENNHITENAASGVATEDGAQVLNNKIDWNGQQGYTAHGSSILYEGNEIAYNNADLAIDATWEAGGGKAWETTNATFKSNHVHHNGGHGLWDDTNNIYIRYEGNNVHDNWGAGIYHEIGYDATIINNTITNNGTSTSQGGGEGLGWLWDAGITLRGSGGLTSGSPILISGNTVTNNYNGIALLDSPASGCTNVVLNEGAYGPCIIQNILVTDNIVTMSQGATGAVQDGAGSAIFNSRNVVFSDNTYIVSSFTHPNDGYTYNWFAWMDDWHDWASWQGFGNDIGGSFGL